MYGLQTTKRSHKRYDIGQYNNVALGSQVSYNVFDVVSILEALSFDP